MGLPKIHPQGYWLSFEEGHAFDHALAQELGVLLRGKTICDFGCGLGKYVEWLRQVGLECEGYDGNPNTEELSFGMCHSLNLAEPVDLQRRYDVVISLEVAEHIPRRYESIFLDNLARHAKEMIVLSWAVPGQPGDGHINCRMNIYAIYQLWRRGFRFEPRATSVLRGHCSLPWFQNTLMAFSRTGTGHFRREVRAEAKILLEDVKRLKRDNSSLVGASVGKLAREFGRVARWTLKVVALLRVLQYDAAVIRKRTCLNAGEAAEERARFVVICFTCAKHFLFCRIALLSLRAWAPMVKEVHVYMDKLDPFSSAQCKLLQSEVHIPLAFERTRYGMSWAGSRVILNELYAFRSLCKRMKMGEFLVKVDSDVICLSDSILKFAVDNNAPAAGTSVRRMHPFMDDDYMQGGCYVISAAALDAMVKRRITRSAYVLLQKRGYLPEDQFISTLLRQCGVGIVYTDALYFNSTLLRTDLIEAQLRAELAAIPPTASVLHFEGNKANMVRAARTLCSLLPSDVR